MAEYNYWLLMQALQAADVSVFNRKGEICEVAQKELTQHYSKGRLGRAQC